MEQRLRSLSQAVRPGVVRRLVGELWCVLALLSLAPPAVAALAREPGWIAPMLVPAVLLAGAGLALRRGPAPAHLQTNEALAATAVVFVTSPVLAAIPLVMAGVPAVDALFEAISGVTTTGLSTLGSVEREPRTLLFARAWLQWYGGLGFAVLSLVVVAGPGLAARRLLATSAEADDLLGSARPHARRVLVAYACLTAGGVVLLWLACGDGFEALVHTLSAVSTGGFAPRDASLAGRARGFQAAVSLLCLAGAVSLPRYHELRRHGLRALSGDLELRALLSAVLLGAALLAALGRATGELGAVDATLLAVSGQTTAGFSSVRVAELDAASKLVLLSSMAVGGSVGSTAGGVKLLRLLVAIQVTRWLLVRTRLPSHAVAEPSLAGAPLRPEDVQRALVVIGLFVVAALVSWFPFLVAGHVPLDALFEVVSALGTVGLSTGIASGELAAPLKAVLCVDMLLGRLEVIAILVALSPGTWLGRRTD